ncbi:MarR family transcriptional regulator [Mycobacterium sp. CVI_P3]|uniref:MarR family transcriptional regulator n=1 Tax=Mycobacterium pinniadriaticum TaxID=2994102 RepID=A0ABT3S9U5_9MYCO|nr:MarR family transcriptional regulator [Mycobacterium pinniadriaticum]MCX2929723.1 MarR family transcriptional regulator [Mycobacterium pinniadriaticum]MCX2936147.1 MarR family transcriptional regulator [Mycobacterium pinniadriaticum]
MSRQVFERAVDGPAAADIDAVLRASRALVGIAAASIAEISEVVTVPQLRVLVMIDTRGPLNLASVATALEISPSNASRICDRLIRAGFLNRQDSPTDRRNISLTLTTEGRQLVRKMNRHRRRAITRVLRAMTAQERRSVVTALDAFAAAAGEPADDGLRLVWSPA